MMLDSIVIYLSYKNIMGYYYIICVDDFFYKNKRVGSRFVSDSIFSDVVL